MSECVSIFHCPLILSSTHSKFSELDRREVDKFSPLLLQGLVQMKSNKPLTDGDYFVKEATTQSSQFKKHNKKENIISSL